MRNKIFVFIGFAVYSCAKLLLWFGCSRRSGVVFRKYLRMFCSILLGCLSSVVQATEVSYSLFDSHGVPFDEKLLKLMNFPNGVFVEVGAFDGVVQSNTKRLEEFHGWTGILVEPSEILFSLLKANRPNSRCFQCALGSLDQNNTYLWGDFDGIIMSSVNGSRLHRPASERVLVRSLQSILDEINIHHINLLSLDVEGYELEVLHGINFDRSKFDYMLIEVYDYQYEDIVSFLSKQGYELIENFSNYNHEHCPDWDGTHNDYLFRCIFPFSG